MSEIKHTPGPWAVHGYSAHIVPANHLRRPIGGAEDDALDLANYAQEICALHHPDRHRPESETRANARLIAAAPELVEPFDVVDNGDWRALDLLLGHSAHGQFWRDVFEKLRPAIAKATGAA